MSLLMLKTKNLSWQDHTLNIEAMLAPLRSTLLMNKHKTLDTKFDQEKALYQRQRDACIKDFVVEKRLIERRRQKILRRKKELMQEIRSQSALDSEDRKSKALPGSDDNKERSLSAPSNGRGRHGEKEAGGEEDGVANIVSSLPRLSLRHTPLFGGTPLRPRLFLETGVAPPSESDSQSAVGKNSRQKSLTSSPRFFLTGDNQSASTTRSKSGKSKPTPTPSTPAKRGLKPAGSSILSKPPLPAPPPPYVTRLGKDTPTTDRSTARGGAKRIPNVTFLGLLDDTDDNDSEFDNDGRIKQVVVEVKQKTLENKVRDFLKELDAFNSRPPTACSEDMDEVHSVFSSVRSRDVAFKAPLVANKYQTLTLDKKLLEKAFDKYMERKSHEDLLKAMKLAAKMKAHIRQARNTSLVPTMAAMKSSRTFLKLLKRQQRREKQAHAIPVQ